MPKVEKKVKKFKLEYFLIIILSLIALVIFFSSFSGGSTFNLFSDTKSEESVDIESKLSKLISNIDGVGKTIITVNLDGSLEEIVLKNTETITENGKTITTENAVLINGKPYVIKEKPPKVLGVVVVCEGADNIKTKLAITEVITTCLEVSSDNIRILKMK